MLAEGIAVYGNISIDELSDAIRKAFPDRKVSVTNEVVTKTVAQRLTRTELLVAKTVASETERMLQNRLHSKEKEHKEAEESAAKALLTIQTLHMQQKQLFDEFVLLRQRYDEQKFATITILWTHCTKFHPDLRMIPDQKDPKIFTETEDQIGEFRVGEPLGEGQFATVKNCYLEDDPKEYALKIINKDRITSFTALMRVSTEIDNLKMLKNPYIVSVNDVIHTETKLYIVTEKGGRDLFEFFDEHPDGVPEDWAKQIIACVMKGVMFCHDQGICHRDLKPENILVSFDAQSGRCIDLKLCDFGLSTKFKPKALLVDFCGSPGFFAPEMIIHGSYYGDKADVWSTGCILLELVAGHEKFCDVWMTAYDYEVLKDKEKFTDTINDTLDQLPEMLNFSPELNNFILKFLELSQSKRPSTAHLCSHAWLDGLVDEELQQRSMLKLSTEGTGLTSTINSCKYPHPFLGGGGGDSPSQSLRNLLPSNGTGEGATEEDHRLYVEMIFANLSERERKHMQEYILHHKNDGPDQHHAQMHLPPIVPSTPNIGNAKKILRKGNELANANYGVDVHSPLGRGNSGSSYGSHNHSSNNIHIGIGAHGASGHNLGAAFSPEYTAASPMTPVRMPGSSRSNSISPLPGVSENEVEDFEARRAHDKYHTPQHSQHKLVSNSFKSSLSNQAASHPSSRHAEPKQLLFASQSDRDLQEENALTLSSSSH